MVASVVIYFVELPLGHLPHNRFGDFFGAFLRSHFQQQTCQEDSAEYLSNHLNI